MYWDQWVNSDYNTGNYKGYNDYVILGSVEREEMQISDTMMMVNIYAQVVAFNGSPVSRGSLVIMDGYDPIYTTQHMQIDSITEPI